MEVVFQYQVLRQVQVQHFLSETEQQQLILFQVSHLVGRSLLIVAEVILL